MTREVSMIRSRVKATAQIALVTCLMALSIGGATKLAVDIVNRVNPTAVEPSPVDIFAGPRAESLRRSCADAASDARSARAFVAAKRMRPALDVADRDIRGADACGIPTVAIATEADLRSQRAVAEHALHEGDWKTDFDIADFLLTQCALLPDATRATATHCDRQEEENAARQDAWTLN